MCACDTTGRTSFAVVFHCCCDSNSSSHLQIVCCIVTSCIRSRIRCIFLSPEYPLSKYILCSIVLCECLGAMYLDFDIQRTIHIIMMVSKDSIQTLGNYIKPSFLVIFVSNFVLTLAHVIHWSNKPNYSIRKPHSAPPNKHKWCTNTNYKSSSRLLSRFFVCVFFSD